MSEPTRLVMAFHGALFGAHGGLDCIVAIVCFDLCFCLVVDAGFLRKVDAVGQLGSFLSQSWRTMSVVIRSVDLMVVSALSPAAMSNFMPSPGWVSL